MGWPYTSSPVRRIRFSGTEVRHILLAVLVLVFAFALWQAGGLGASATRLLSSLIVATIAVPTGFLLHEFGHKLVAQSYGHWAEFRAYTYGLILAVVTALLGFLFAAPGAVRIAGPVTRRESGRISLAGPLVNLVIGAVFLAGAFVLQGAGINPVVLGGLGARTLLEGVALINLLLGAFNMIPFPPLDGSKVVRWDLRAYGVTLAALVGLLVLLFLPGIP